MHFAKYILTRAKIYLEGAKKFFGLFLENTNCKQQYEAWVNTRGASCEARRGRGGAFPCPEVPGWKGYVRSGKWKQLRIKKGRKWLLLTSVFIIYVWKREGRTLSLNRYMDDALETQSPTYVSIKYTWHFRTRCKYYIERENCTKCMHSYFNAFPFFVQRFLRRVSFLEVLACWRNVNLFFLVCVAALSLKQFLSFYVSFLSINTIA